MSHPDRIILNGALITFDPARPHAEALAITGQHITALGTNAEMRGLAGPDTEVIDAGGGTVLPGFIDSHVHLFGGAAELDLLDLAGLRGLDRLTEAVRAYATSRPNDRLLLGVSAEYDIVAPGTAATRHDLDRVMPDRPLALMTADHHTVFANTAALEAAGLLHGASLPPGAEVVMGPDGTATGQLNETDAFGPVLRMSPTGGRDAAGYVNGRDPEPPATAAERARDKEVILRGLHHCAAHGLTGLHNMDGNFYQMELLAELEAEGRLPLRVQVPMHLKNTDPLDRIDEALEMQRRFASAKVYSGRVKMFMDGVLDSYTALMLEPYPGKPGSVGDAVFEPDQFNAACIRADALGLQISVHAIGDGAVRRTLDGYEAARRANGARDSRHRVEHIEVLHPDDLPRFAELGAVASIQPLHSPAGGLFPPYPVGDILSERQIPHAFAWKALRASGARVCFSTDWPVVPVDVMPTVAGAVHGAALPAPWVDNRQTLMDTLASYTLDNAWVEFAEARKGKLAPGYLADIAVLEKDLTTLPTEDLAGVRTRHTMCDGQTTFQAG